MNAPSTKLRERLLYLISPVGLLLLWQVLVMLGFGDRRFIPTPSDIAVRFWQLSVSGELAVNLLATLWRVAAGLRATAAVRAVDARPAGHGEVVARHAPARTARHA